MLQGMVGTTPVIVGRKLETTYHLTGTSLKLGSVLTHMLATGPPSWS